MSSNSQALRWKAVSDNGWAGSTIAYVDAPSYSLLGNHEAGCSDELGGDIPMATTKPASSVRSTRPFSPLKRGAPPKLVPLS